MKVRDKLTRCIRNNKPEVYKLNLLQQKCKYSFNRYFFAIQNSHNNKYNFCNCKIAVFQIKNKKGRYLQKSKLPPQNTVSIKLHKHPICHKSLSFLPKNLYVLFLPDIAYILIKRGTKQNTFNKMVTNGLDNNSKNCQHKINEYLVLD